MFKFKVRIREHERGVRLRHGNFVRVLDPGLHRLWSRLWLSRRDRIEVFDTLATRFEHPLLDVIATRPESERALQVVDLTDAQRAVVWKDGRVAYILGPGRHAFWRAPARLHVETFHAAEEPLQHAQLAAILAHPHAKAWLELFEVSPLVDVLLLRDGVLIGKLPQGRHAFWKTSSTLVFKAIDRREQLADVAGQEVLTADKVTLRVNLLVAYQIVDAVKAVTTVADASQALYREAQLALRAAIGTRPLDVLLADKQAIGQEVRETLAARVAEFGVEIRSVGLRDIILPGDVRDILNQVIAAEKQAQANLIKRREETAAARSQANTARLLAENPVLARMKELELLQEILAGTKATFVLGNGDLLQQVSGLIRKENSGDTS